MKNTKIQNNDQVTVLPLKKDVVVELGQYSIIETGGKQYFALVGKTIMIEKLPQQPGEEVIFNAFLFKKNNEEYIVGNPHLSEPTKGVVVKHLRGKKVIVFKFKRRKKYRKKQGHRQSYTVVRITSI